MPPATANWEEVFFMKETENQDKVRCAEFLLRMYEKYGAEIQEEERKEKRHLPADNRSDTRHSVDINGS